MGWTFFKSDGSALTSIGTTADIATTVTVTDNESTNENNVLTFVAGADADGGNVGLESDGNLHYNPSTGLLTSTGFAGALTGNVTGNASGTAATVTGGTQAAITAAANLVTVGTIGTGVWQGTVVAAAYLPDAAVDAQGVVELAVASEVTTGTSATLAVTPDGLAGSVYGERVIQMVVVDFATALTTGDGKFYFHVPSTLNGFDIVDVHAEVISAPAGSTIIIQLHNLTATADILTTLLTIDASETGSDTAAAAAVISGSEDDLTTNDVIRVDIDQIGSSTAGSGLRVTLICRLP